MMNEIDGLINRLRNEADQLGNGNTASVWRRYESVVASMSAEQRTWVDRQESVLQAKSVMYSDFIGYLFDQYKDSFVSVGDGKYLESAENYIKAIREAGDSFVSRTELLEKENAELREKISQFMNMNRGKKNEPVAAG